MCIGHRICFRHDPSSALKSHEKLLAIAEEWKNLSRQEKKKKLTAYQTGGFKRESLCLQWEKFDTVTGFCLDIMHQSDEGLSMYFIEQLMDRTVSLLGLSDQQRTELNQRWLQITAPGQNDRQPRSLFEFKRYKAHELRFFLHFGFRILLLIYVLCTTNVLCAL